MKLQFSFCQVMKLHFQLTTRFLVVLQQSFDLLWSYKSPIIPVGVLPTWIREVEKS